MKRTPPVNVERDRWGRPIIDGNAYTRASTLAKALDDTTNLTDWACRMTALGVARSADLIALAATANPDDRSTLNDVVERAKDRAGAGGGRDTGTAIHAATEMVDCGEDISHLPTDLQRDARAYVAARNAIGYDPIVGEMFVANWDLLVAGSFDRLGLRGDLAMIGDIKTGKADKDAEYAARYNSVAWATQLAVYASGMPWRPGGFVDWPVRPDQNTGVIFYLQRGAGACTPIILDLEEGMRLARLAVDVRQARKSRPVLSIGQAVSA